MVEAKNDLGTTLCSLTIQEDIRPEVPWQGGINSAAHPPCLYKYKFALQPVEPDARPLESSVRVAGVLSKQEATGHVGRRPHPISSLQGPSILSRQYCRIDLGRCQPGKGFILDCRVVTKRKIGEWWKQIMTAVGYTPLSSS